MYLSTLCSAVVNNDLDSIELTMVHQVLEEYNSLPTP